jgi:NifU-like protein involved in Fe-S cluster formation
MLHQGETPPAPFSDYAALKGAASFRNRHTCVLLPIEAVLKAFSNRG